MNPTKTVTRRGAVGGTLVAAASLSRPLEAAAKRAPGKRAPRLHDVAVVGAGLAGLTAARDIAAKGKSVVVLEARDRVGGRVWNQDLGDGHVVEAGAEFIGPTQNAIAAMADAVGVKSFKTFNSGNNIYVRKGTVTPYATDGPLGAVPPDLQGALDAETAILKLNSMAAEIDVARPWAAPHAAEWDSQTFKTWIDSNTTLEGGKFLLEVAVQGLLSCQPRDVSLLYFVFYVAAAGDERHPGTVERLINVADGGQESRLVGGTQAVPLAMAKQLGRRVVLSNPVRRIIQRRGYVEVVGDQRTVRARKVIVAVPLTLAGRIDYDPVMPAMRDGLMQRMPNGSEYKISAVYDKPFWREDGLTGQILGDLSPINTSFDSSPPDASVGIMTGFSEGIVAREWATRSVEDYTAAAIANFVTCFGPKASRPRKTVVQHWNADPWARGCPVCYGPPGVMLDFGRFIREPVGAIHWAGTETATYWTGYMDGAVSSGHRAANEVLAAL